MPPFFLLQGAIFSVTSVARFIRLIVVPAWLGVVCFLTIVAASSANDGEGDSVPMKAHAWGAFKIGAWKQVRVTTESFSEKGTTVSISTSDTTTFLEDKDDSGLSLEVQSCFDMGGKRYDAQPQSFKQGWHGEILSPALKVHPSTQGQVEIDGRVIPCRVWKLESNSASSKMTTTLYYASNVAPYVLKRESVATDLEGKNVLSETAMTVTELDMTAKVLGANRRVAYVKTVQVTPKGKTVTLSTTTPDVPGGIVANSTKETDASGRVVRSSTLEVLGYGTEPEKERVSSPGRKRSNRSRGGGN